ncbi:histidine triad nucleotide-binding protein [Cerasicoccus fimbriatus]|uniref:histidine triad nucleotide-binding protein n=1 Tax=Cerasicoccus fimbriatus TaxID=3014554 RepID=UPI0022B3B566|nr:histidine triad nucleotide-binding protein [Cerasicoccus sp. TK19100]
MPEKTIFQKIIDREIPATIEYEDDDCLCFRDIAPQAPTHLLVIPKKLIVRIGESTDNDAALLGHLMIVARKMGNQFGGENGFRLVINNGPDGGEAVPHLHIHVLAGRSLQWPPG